MSSDPSDMAGRGMRLLLRAPTSPDAVAVPRRATAPHIVGSARVPRASALCVRIPKTYELVNVGEL